MSAAEHLAEAIAVGCTRNDEHDHIADHRGEVIAERDAQIIAWLEKKAREQGTSNKDSRVRRTAIYRMADKLSRGAVRPPLSGAPTPPQENYPGELAMLRGLLGVLRAVAKHGDMAEVQRLLAEHTADEQAAYAEEKDTAPAAPHPAAEIKFVDSPAPITLTGWALTELAPDYYGHTYMQLDGWLPANLDRDQVPGGTTQLEYAHLHGRTVPDGLNVQVEVKGYGEPSSFIKIQWRKDGAA
ncbi:hypothetical protein AB0I93_14460 [Streptomyces sp. NPDC049967]|uniref:hypothetical protein n=1 Tax=Streptomyces sp. NPDC049967 TaxID=3155658 RepID=UPI00343D938C